MRESLRKGVSRVGRSRLGLAAAFACALGVAAVMGAPSAAFAQGASSQAATPMTVNQARKQKAKAEAAAQQARKAQTHPKAEPKGFMETIMEGPRFTTTPPEAADWVRSTRRDPNTAKAAARPPGPGRAVLTADQIKAQEAQLDRLRASHDKVAGRKAPTGKFGSAAGKPEAPEPAKYKPGCSLTCANPISVPRTQRR